MEKRKEMQSNWIWSGLDLNVKLVVLVYSCKFNGSLERTNMKTQNSPQDHSYMHIRPVVLLPHRLGIDRACWERSSSWLLRWFLSACKHDTVLRVSAILKQIFALTFVRKIKVIRYQLTRIFCSWSTLWFVTLFPLISAISSPSCKEPGERKTPGEV